MHLYSGLSDIFECTFENDTCGMVMEQTDNYQWTRHSGGTASSNTGPSQGDSQSRFYVYAEASNQQPGTTAR